MESLLRVIPRWLDSLEALGIALLRLSLRVVAPRAADSLTPPSFAINRPASVAGLGGFAHRPLATVADPGGA